MNNFQQYHKALVELCPGAMSSAIFRMAKELASLTRTDQEAISAIAIMRSAGRVLPGVEWLKMKREIGVTS